ncbi:magnesium transporter [Clostridium massiliamazoniense]|uniref:magnesium transporter n=1 Tax=Clostridium massiliamazoniense TaxID=1347366 RepID=UPI0006D78301|nr:CBS domain-containing protein [Clostridium massiliamazoniense]
MNRLTFFLYSSILNNNIYDEFDENIGVLKDIYVTSEGNYLKIIGYKVKKDGVMLDLEFKKIDFYQKDNGKIKIETVGSSEILPTNYSYLLTKHILDKKIVDIDGKKVVNVEDIRIAEVSAEYRVIAVETGKYVKFRKKGLETVGKFLSNIFKDDFEERVIMWDKVESVETANESLQISVPYKKLQTLHPADLADILEELDVANRNKVFRSLDEDLAAETLEEIDSKVQESIIKNLSEVRTAELFENIPNDEIADMLDELSEDERDRILTNLESDDAEEVRELMSYKEETAGSIMNKDFVAFNYSAITIGEVINVLKETKPDEEAIYSIYITDEDEKIKGVVKFSDLILQDNNCKLEDIMNKNPIYININDHMSEAAEVIAKYDLMSVPVVDDEEKIRGIVIIYDIIDEIFMPTHRKKIK